MRHNEQAVWVDFKYEKMTLFYFYCGLVGHSERNCSLRKCDSREDKIQDGQYGKWLRVDINRIGLKQSSSKGQVKKDLVCAEEDCESSEGEMR